MVIAASTGSGGSISFLPILLIFGVVMFFFTSRNSRKRAAQAKALVDSMVVGSEVMTTAGIYGHIAALDDDIVHVTVAPGVTLRLNRRAISKVITPTVPDSPAGLERTHGSDLDGTYGSDTGGYPDSPIQERPGN